MPVEWQNQLSTITPGGFLAGLAVVLHLTTEAVQIVGEADCRGKQAVHSPTGAHLPIYPV